MLFVQIQNIFLPVCSSSSSILSRPITATVTNWVTSRLHEPSKPARSFSLLHRHQLDPQGEGQEARERGGSLVKGIVGKAMSATPAATVKSFEKHHQVTSSCCAAAAPVASAAFRKASIRLQWRRRELPETLLMGQMDKMC